MYSDDDKTKDSLNLQNPEETNEQNEVVSALLDKLVFEGDDLDENDK